ncbi:hypothetical protein HWV62_6643 [Athelia sp. TMB]|nr:hypothetical protein HWV62_6643 [Athelia sp. TMB]
MPNSSSSPSYSGSKLKGGSFGRSARAPPPAFKGGRKGKSGGSLALARLALLEGPTHAQQHIETHFADQYPGAPLPKPVLVGNPKGSLSNWMSNAYNQLPSYESKEGRLEDGRIVWRTMVKVQIPGSTELIGTGDDRVRKESERLAALAALYDLQGMGLLDKAATLKKATIKDEASTTIKLSDNTEVDYERARQFIDYYCRRYKFGKPDVDFNPIKSGWEAVMAIDGRRIGMGNASNKKNSQTACYLDVTQYLESCDPDLWKAFVDAAKSGRDLGMAPPVWLHMGSALTDEIRDLCHDIRKSSLYRHRPARKPATVVSTAETRARPSAGVYKAPALINAKSTRLLKRRQEYLRDPFMQKMRDTRTALPVFTKAAELLTHVEANDVTICMAATGSGKTTQLPQIILDDWIEKNRGAECNIVCTQPRRIAAISVADRVAKERGEVVGRGSVGYQVRFDAKLPEPNGSITFCTTGIFLKWLQAALSEGGSSKLDDVTHVVVDEVHERDVDTDLLLVVLKRLLEERKAQGRPIKVLLMSATIDPTLFQKYFPDNHGQPAKVIEVPGRSFPVTKHFLDDFVPELKKDASTAHLLRDPLVEKYLNNELPASGFNSSRLVSGEMRDDLDLPHNLIALTIAHVLKKTDTGHVLVFLPGWEEIQATQKTLLSPSFGVKFNDPSQYTIHLLHSSVPLAEQQIVFEPPAPGVRRIILATNIAETSVTIPDVVYVVDTGKVKEQRYDPDRHVTSLVSAWVGSSNLNQRAGRAGRHRSGEYFGLLGNKRLSALQPYQTVEIKRTDLSNVVMHVKALDFPGMTVEEVLAATIEPPEAGRVEAAMKNLQMVGALDSEKALTALGRVLLQLPVDAQMGRMVLYGSFFRCLDKALTLAAILTNRDPFLSPPMMKAEAAKVKNSWAPPDFRSDALAILRAYDAWWDIQRLGHWDRAHRFCSDNFLSRPTLMTIQKIKGQLLQSLYHAGVIDVSAGGVASSNPIGRGQNLTVPPELNTNGESLPLMAALITVASQPKFAVRTSDKGYRTMQEKMTFMHPSSVNNRKHEDSVDTIYGEKQLYAFAEKRQNLTGGGNNINMLTTTRIDPMTYVLFGAYEIEVVSRGLECDGWLPVNGHIDTLDDIERLKTLMESCMLRVFEGIMLSRQKRSWRDNIPLSPREEAETDDDEEPQAHKHQALTSDEIRELDLLTRDMVRILNRFGEERITSQSRHTSRSATPMASPAFASLRLPSIGSRSGYSSPYNIGSAYNSRPGTPSRLGPR